MKTQVLFGIGNLKYTSVDTPVPREKEALVRVLACGICGSDIPRIYKTGAHNMPIIPGHEFSGIVEQCSCAPDLIGQRVGVFPLIPCKKCKQCLSGHYEMCENYNYLGSRCDGGFAEYVSVPVWNLLPLPDEVTDEEAAMLEPMCVAIHSLRRAGLYKKNIRKSSSIVVCGLGTIGLLTAMLLKDMGFKNLYFIGNKDIQKNMLAKMGYSPENICDVRFGDPVAFVMDKTNGKGADYYLECIGRSESYEQAIKCAAPLGTVMLVGNPASDMELKRDSYWKILRNQLTLLGTWNSSYYGRNECSTTDTIDMLPDSQKDDWQLAIDTILKLKSGNNADTADKKTGKKEASFSPANLITHRFPLSDLGIGLDIMHRKSEEYVKIMIKM